MRAGPRYVYSHADDRTKTSRSGAHRAGPNEAAQATLIAELIQRPPGCPLRIHAAHVGSPRRCRGHRPGSVRPGAEEPRPLRRPAFRFSTWLFTIAKRLYVNAMPEASSGIRHRLTVGACTRGVQPTPGRESPPADRETSANNSREVLATSPSHGLNAQQREIILLFHQQNWPISDIAIAPGHAGGHGQESSASRAEADEEDHRGEQDACHARARRRTFGHDPRPSTIPGRTRGDCHLDASCR